MNNIVDKRFLLESLRSEPRNKNPNSKTIDKQFLIETVKQDDENDTLSKFQAKKHYFVKEKLELSFNLKTLFTQGVGFLDPNTMDKKLQGLIPIRLFGLTDFFSGYFASYNYILKQPSLYTVYCNGIVNFNYPINFSSNETLPQAIQPLVSSGDYLQCLKQSINPFTYYCFSILSTSNQIGYGTILNNLADSNYLIKNIRIRVNSSNVDMFDNPLIFSRLKINGQIETDSINIRTYVKPSDFQTSIVDLPLNIILDKNLIINHAIKYNCETVDYTFTLFKIK